MIYTAQYNYDGKDRIDITVKSAPEKYKIFAPTWDMVMEFKRTGDTGIYKFLYSDILDWALTQKFDTINEIVKQACDSSVTFVCFCPPKSFCHRVLLSQWFENNFHIKYAGERGLV